jgi:hypothetical protein
MNVARVRPSLAVLGLALFAGGCTVGEGEGWVRSERLYVEDCWNGPFDLDPDFFGANPYREESLLIRIQRGDNIEEQSDGLTVLVNDIQELRKNLNTPVNVGLPVGVSPPGVPVTPVSDAPKVSLSVYLHNSCHVQNAVVYSMSGTITFQSLFSGDPNEDDAEQRLTEASFEASFADPRRVAVNAAQDPEATSVVRGYFRFYFQRGQPAQPFP